MIVCIVLFWQKQELLTSGVVPAHSSGIVRSEHARQTQQSPSALSIRYNCC